MGLASVRQTLVQYETSEPPVHWNLYPRVYACLYDGVRLRLRASASVRPSHADVQIQDMATVPRSTRAQNGLLYCQGLRSVFTGWSLPFVDPWKLVSKASVGVTRILGSFITCARRGILIKRIPVNVGPFCDAMERLCGSLILAHRFMTGRGILHGVTLPRSWFIGLSRSLTVLNKDTNCIPRFVDDAIELLRRVDLQREHYGPQTGDNQQFKHNGSRLGPLHASVYIARM